MTTVVRFGERTLKKLIKSKYNCFSSKMISSDSQTSAISYDSFSHKECVKKILQFIPKLTQDLHKGQCGRIGIIGGCAEYTGAPYFSAISALKAGADLVYVFCSRDAAPVIKSYSPELIVNPILDSDNFIAKIQPWLERLHTLVIGPGLGRDPGLLKNVGSVITYCKEKIKPSLPLIIDADGLYLITDNKDLLKGYNGPIILTPNPVEYGRLVVKLTTAYPLQIAADLNVVLVQKGLNDLIINGIYNKTLKLGISEVTLVCELPGSNRRCGGQGDILSGCMATFVTWYHLHKSYNLDNDFKDIKCSNAEEDGLNLFNEKFLGYSLAAYGACAVTRTCSKLAFEKLGRSMTASDMIQFIPKVFETLFEQ